MSQSAAIQNVTGSDSPTYSKRSGTSGILGQWYETKLLSLVLFRALHRKEIKSFHLATNLDEAGAFDDIAVQYSDGKTDKWIFLQAKHVGRRSLNLKDIISIETDTGNFSFVKYFKSYLDLKMNIHNGCFSMMNGSKHDDDELIIFTTANINYEKTGDSELKAQRINANSKHLFFTSEKGTVIELSGSLQLLQNIASEWYIQKMFRKLDMNSSIFFGILSFIY